MSCSTELVDGDRFLARPDGEREERSERTFVLKQKQRELLEYKTCSRRKRSPSASSVSKVTAMSERKLYITD